MSDAIRLGQEVTRLLRRHLPWLSDHHRAVVGLMLTGILKGRSVQFRAIADEVHHSAKKASLETRFERLVRNEHLEVEATYLPFAKLILASLGSSPLVLVLDSSKVGRGCLCLMIGVVYKSRALPLAWLVYKGKKGHSTASRQLSLLQAVYDLLPPEMEVVLVADGEFDSAEVIDWLTAEPVWHFVCRTAKTTKVFWHKTWRFLEDLTLPPGQETFLPGVHFTESKQVGPVNIWVAWAVKDQAHLYFVTNVPTAAAARHWYTKRFKIETLFSDSKGRGFHLDKSGLREPRRLERLLLLTAIAYLFVVFLGVELIQAGPATLLARTQPFYDSLFQLGLTYLKHLLNACLPFPCFSRLPRPDSFSHPVYAPPARP